MAYVVAGSHRIANENPPVLRHKREPRGPGPRKRHRLEVPDRVLCLDPHRGHPHLFPMARNFGTNTRRACIPYVFPFFGFADATQPLPERTDDLLTPSVVVFEDEERVKKTAKAVEHELQPDGSVSDEKVAPPKEAV